MFIIFFTCEYTFSRLSCHEEYLKVAHCLHMVYDQLKIIHDRKENRCFKCADLEIFPSTSNLSVIHALQFDKSEVKNCSMLMNKFGKTVFISVAIRLYRIKYLCLSVNKQCIGRKQLTDGYIRIIGCRFARTMNGENILRKNEYEFLHFIQHTTCLVVILTYVLDNI
jgi:hypothetical protein